jgi:hypothetical protein
MSDVHANQNTGGNSHLNKHAVTLMRGIGINALHRRPRTRVAH